MPKIAFLGAGSTVFARNVLGDCLLSEALRESEFALFDIDPQRLKDSEMMLNNLNRNTGGYGKIVAYTDRKAALRGADYVICAIQVGGYEPCTVTDFEVPKKYGLQTIGDTGIGGIFRALRTLPAFRSLPVTSKRSVLMRGSQLRRPWRSSLATCSGLLVKTVGLCHSVRICVPAFGRSGMSAENVQWKIAGIQPYGLAFGSHSQR